MTNEITRTDICYTTQDALGKEFVAWAGPVLTLFMGGSRGDEIADFELAVRDELAYGLGDDAAAVTCKLPIIAA